MMKGETENVRTITADHSWWPHTVYHVISVLFLSSHLLLKKLAPRFVMAALFPCTATNSGAWWWTGLCLSHSLHYVKFKTNKEQFFLVSKFGQKSIKLSIFSIKQDSSEMHIWLTCVLLRFLGFLFLSIAVLFAYPKEGSAACWV